MDGAKLIINWRHDLEQILIFSAPIGTYIKIKLNKLNECNLIYVNLLRLQKSPHVHLVITRAVRAWIYIDLCKLKP